MVAVSTSVATKIPKSDREKYGRLGKPIPATRVYQARFSRFSDPTVAAFKWVLVNEVTNTVTFANSYNGKLGDRYNLDVNTHPLTGANAKKHAKRIRSGGDYSEVSIVICPFATLASQVYRAA